MIAADTLVPFVVAAFIMIVIPGPSVLFTIGRAIALGRTGGLLSVLGISLGSIVLVVGVALGVGTVIAQSAVLFLIVKVLGAAYLVYLGVQAIRHRKDAATAASTEAAPRSGRRLLGEGVVVGVTNPKSIAFFVAVLPQFVDLGAGAVPTQMLLLGTIVVAIGLLCDTLWVLLASAARGWFGRSPRRLATMSATGGGMMIALGVFLLAWNEKPVTA